MFWYYVIFIILFDVFIFIKNEVTFKRTNTILDAIYDYSIDCISHNSECYVCFDDMVPYKVVLFRFWDWGYEHILPKEKYEIIKPYIR